MKLQFEEFIANLFLANVHISYHLKTFGSLVCSAGITWEHWPEMGERFLGEKCSCFHQLNHDTNHLFTMKLQTKWHTFLYQQSHILNKRFNSVTWNSLSFRIPEVGILPSIRTSWVSNLCRYIAMVIMVACYHIPWNLQTIP